MITRLTLGLSVVEADTGVIKALWEHQAQLPEGHPPSGPGLPVALNLLLQGVLVLDSMK